MVHGEAASNFVLLKYLREDLSIPIDNRLSSLSAHAHAKKTPVAIVYIRVILIVDGYISPCLMRKTVVKSEAILALLDTFQELPLEW